MDRAEEGTAAAGLAHRLDSARKCQLRQTLAADGSIDDTLLAKQHLSAKAVIDCPCSILALLLNLSLKLDQH